MASADALVGRGRELALIHAEVARLSEGRATLLAIEGEAGIGKTRLVESIIDDARSRGMAVSCGRAHPFEPTRPFGLVAAALGLGPRSPNPRSAAIGALLADRSAGASGSTDLQYRIVDEIVDLVETACAERPVLLVAEDIHWADTASLLPILSILSIARRLPLAPLLAAVTTRPSPLLGDVVRLLDDLAAGGGRTLRLQPLTPDDVAALASHVLGASPGPGLSAVLAKAGGNRCGPPRCCAPWPTRGRSRRTTMSGSKATVRLVLGGTGISRRPTLSRSSRTRRGERGSIGAQLRFHPLRRPNA